MAVIRKIKVKTGDPDIFQEKDLGALATNVKFADGTNCEKVNGCLKKEAINNAELTAPQGNHFDFYYLYYCVNVGTEKIYSHYLIDNSLTLGQSYYQSHTYFTDDYKIDIIIKLNFEPYGTALFTPKIIVDKKYYTRYSGGQILKPEDKEIIKQKNPNFPGTEGAPEFIEVESTFIPSETITAEIKSVCLVKSV